MVDHLENLENMLHGVQAGEIMIISAGRDVGKSKILGIDMDWIIVDELHDNIKDLSEQEKAQKRRSRDEKSYLDMMPKYNKGKNP
jgi:hypothetical protein